MKGKTIAYRRGEVAWLNAELTMEESDILWNPIAPYSPGLERTAFHQGFEDSLKRSIDNESTDRS